MLSAKRVTLPSRPTSQTSARCPSAEAPPAMTNPSRLGVAENAAPTSPSGSSPILLQLQTLSLRASLRMSLWYFRWPPCQGILSGKLVPPVATMTSLPSASRRTAAIMPARPSGSGRSGNGAACAQASVATKRPSNGIRRSMRRGGLFLVPFRRPASPNAYSVRSNQPSAERTNGRSSPLVSA